MKIIQRRITLFLLFILFLGCQKVTVSKLDGTWTLKYKYQDGEEKQTYKNCTKTLTFTENSYSITESGQCVYFETGTYLLSKNNIEFNRQPDNYLWSI